MKVAIVGRRNVGKSTLVNTLAQAERMIVSEVPGTTRDSVDVRFELDGKAFMAIDTPGFRRTKSIATDVDFYSTHRAQRSIRRADVVLLFFDATQRISKVDKQLCDYIAQQYKPCMFVVNKWDMLAGTMPTEKWVNYLRDNFRTMWYAPIAFITGQTGKNVKAMLNHAQMLFRQSLAARLDGALNKLVRAVIDKNPPPHPPEPPAQDLLCHASGRAAAHGRALLQRSAGHHAAVPAVRCCGCSATNWSFGEVPIKLYLRRREHGDTRDEGRGFQAGEATTARSIIGVPKEIKRDEYRVGFCPWGSTSLPGPATRCWSKPAPGSAPDWPTRTTPHGAELVPRAAEIYGRAEMIIKVKEPQPARDGPAAAAARSCSPISISPPTGS